MFSVFSWSFVPTLKYSTRPLQVMLLPLISFRSMLRGLRSHGTRTFRLFKKSPSISGRGREATAGERAQHVLKLSCIQFLVLVEEISGKYQQFRAANSQTNNSSFPPGGVSQRLQCTTCSCTIHHTQSSTSFTGTYLTHL